MKQDTEPSDDRNHTSDNEPSEPAPGSSEHTKPHTTSYRGGTQSENKHPLEYAIAILLALTLMATGVAAYYTQQQWLTAVDHETRSLRAYVFVETADFSNTNNMIITTMSIKNSGQTPAYDFSNLIHSKLAIAPNAVDFDEIGTIPTERTIIAPGGKVVPSTKINIGSDIDSVVTAIKEGSGIFFVWGKAEYRDAFDFFWCISYRMRTASLGDGKIFFVPIYQGNSEHRGRCDK